MPRKYAKKRFNKKAIRPNKKRKLGIAGTVFGEGVYNGLGDVGKAEYKQLRAATKRSKAKRAARAARLRRVEGKAVPDAASGAAGGFSTGRKKPMGTILKRRQKRVLAVLADTQSPIIKNHALIAVTQIDWTAATQAVNVYDTGYTTAELEGMITESNYAQATLVASTVTGQNGTSVVNQKMDVYDKVTKMSFKNVCSHTVYVEISGYQCKGYHGFNVLDCWNKALLTDDLLQQPTFFTPVEQVSTSIGNRPSFKFADLNVRWAPRAGSTYKTVLEPGQETSYTYIQKGMRYDQEKYNVLQGNALAPVDPLYADKLTSQIIVICRAEMVTDTLDSDVTYGSGHLAVTKEEWKSWAAVPYCKPRQASFQYGWGTIAATINEADNNQYQNNQDDYQEDP